MCKWGTTTTVDLHGGGIAGVDSCIAPIAQALNDAGIRTIASCCGHGHRPGTIALHGGVELLIMPDYESARALDRLWTDIHGENTPMTAREVVERLHPMTDQPSAEALRWIADYWGDR